MWNADHSSCVAGALGEKREVPGWITWRDRRAGRPSKLTTHAATCRDSLLQTNPIGDLIGISFHHDLETRLTKDSITYRM
jgi:hypothetical protein